MSWYSRNWTTPRPTSPSRTRSGNSTDVPSFPLCRAYRLEEALGTPAKIYYKFEGNNTSGTHKLNSAIAQAYYAKKQGLKGVTTETGAGQWGTALSMACSYLGLDCQVYMVKVSYEQKPFRREVMRTYGASVTPSPSMTTNVGRKILAEHPDTTGSLGCAISEAVEVRHLHTRLPLCAGQCAESGTAAPVRHRSGDEGGLDKLGIKPDIIIGCAGGGSNLGGLISPFMGEKLRGEADYRFIAVEPATCPSFTRGKFSTTSAIPAWSARWPRCTPSAPASSPAPTTRRPALPRHEQHPQPALPRRPDGGPSVEQTSVFEAAEQFARIEGILPAPESSHAIRVAIDEALKCKETGEENHRLRPHRHRLLRHGGLREVPRRQDDRLHPHRRRPAEGL